MKEINRNFSLDLSLNDTLPDDGEDLSSGLIAICTNLVAPNIATTLVL